MRDDSDDTVVQRPERRRPKLPATLLLVLIAVAFLLAATGGAWLLRSPPPGPVQADPGEAEQIAGEADIRDHVPLALTVYRFGPNPAIVVLDFPELHSQGSMLNRVAAWAEKDALPHDRLLPDDELAEAIRASGNSPDTYYYGHDYRGSDLVQFFSLADREGINLNPDEQRLRRLLLQAGAEPAGFGALISLPRAGADTGVDAIGRATILHHELSHGEYFTDPAYATYVGEIWRAVLTAQEQELVRRYLHDEGYDPGIEDLMINEMQAYFMHTPDQRFFDEAKLGIPPARLAAIRSLFRTGMPPGWLRDATPAPPATPRLRLRYLVTAGFRALPPLRPGSRRGGVARQWPR